MAESADHQAVPPAAQAPAPAGMAQPSHLAKRLFDIFLSASSLLALGLPLLLVMVILKFTGEGKVWFLQDRIGYQGRLFKCFKFATMQKDSETLGSKDITLRNDPRVLPFGRILRKAKINELPQLINILIGDMSFVGWRPLTPRNFYYYTPVVQQQIVQSKPGLTGIGSIIFRDEEAITSRAGSAPECFYAEHIAPYKGELELWYQRNQSFWLDLKLILLTARAVVQSGYRLDASSLKGLPPRPAGLD